MDLLALTVAAFGTALLSGVFGMAGGMILMGILASLLPVPAAMALHGVCQATSNGWRAWLLREHVDGRVVRRYLAGALPAAAGVALVAPALPARAVFLLLGAFPLASLLLARRGLPPVERRGVAEGCGAAVTVTQFTAGAAGPLLDLFYLASPMDRRTVVGTKAVTQAAGHLMKTVAFGAAAGGTSGGGVPPLLAAAMLAGVIAGTLAGRRLLDGLPEDRFRVWTRRLVIALSLVALARGLAG